MTEPNPAPGLFDLRDHVAQIVRDCMSEVLRPDPLDLEVLRASDSAAEAILREFMLTTPIVVNRIDAGRITRAHAAEDLPAVGASATITQHGRATYGIPFPEQAGTVLEVRKLNADDPYCSVRIEWPDYGARWVPLDAIAWVLK